MYQYPAPIEMSEEHRERITEIIRPVFPEEFNARINIGANEWGYSISVDSTFRARTMISADLIDDEFGEKDIALAGEGFREYFIESLRMAIKDLENVTK